MTTGAEHSVCGKCGYIVTGLTTFVCPECGSDLRQVGIVRPGAGPSRAGWWLAGKVLAALVSTTLVAALLTFAAVSLVIPSTVIVSYDADYVPLCTLGRSYSIKAERRIYHIGQVDWTQVTRDAMTMDVQGPSGIVKVSLNPETLEYSYRDPRGTSHAGAKAFDAASAVAIMEAAGIPPATPNAAKDAAGIDQLVAMAQRGIKDDATRQLGVNSSSSHRSEPSSKPGSFNYISMSTWRLNDGIAMLCWGVIWITLAAFSIRFVVRHHRRAAANAMIPATAATGPVQPKPPPQAPTVRTLTVLFSDMKDYTARTAEESREGILEIVRRHRDVAQPIIRRHNGELVKTMGDALLATFDSATSAVLAGVEIQQTLQKHNLSAFADREKLRVRIAVSTGEVAIESGDVFGEPVNLASRVQQLAQPGEVLITESTYGTINRQEVRCEEAGTHELKGIQEPVKVFRATAPAAKSAVGLQSGSPNGR